MRKSIPMSAVINREYSQKCRDIHSIMNYTFNGVRNSIRENNINYSIVEPYFKQCINHNNANKYGASCLSLLSDIGKKSSDTKKYNFLLNEFVNSILPYIDNLDDIVNEVECINDIEGRDTILEAVERYKQSDRILHNFNKINEATHISETLNRMVYSGRDMYDIVREVTKIVNGYIPRTPKAAKFNVTLELLLYAFEKYGYNYIEEDLIENLTDVFLVESIEEPQYNRLVNVLESNKFISDDGLKKVGFIYESEDFADSNDVAELIDKYKVYKKKNESLFRRTLEMIYAKSPKNIIDETPKILSFIRTFGVLSTMAINPILAAVLFCIDKFIQMDVSVTETKRIYKYFNNEKARVAAMIQRSKDEEEKERLNHYQKCLDQCIEKIDDYADSISADVNIKDALVESINRPDILKNSKEQFLSEKIGYVSSQLKYAVQLLSNGLYTSPYDNIEKYDSSIDGFCNVSNTSDLSRYVLHNGLIQLLLFKVKYNDIETAYKYVSNLCSSINSQLNNAVVTTTKEVDCLIILFTGLDSLDVSMDNEDKFDEATSIILSDIYEAMNIIIELGEQDKDKLLNDISKKINTSMPDQDSEVMSMIDMGEKLLPLASTRSRSKFIDSISDYAKNTDDNSKSMKLGKVINTINNNLDNSDVSKDDMIDDLNDIREYCELANILLESPHNIKDIQNKIAEKKKKEATKPNNKTNIKGIKNTVSKIKNDTSKSADRMTNNIALAGEALKKDMVNLSDKEKQASRTLDMSMSSFKKSIEKTLTSNKRESIIKGSIIPSFSKMIKIGVAFAGGYLINPVVACIGAIGALAVSKSLTNKERQLILDEIEIELKVLEKEIATAEDNKNMGKYKQLITYQRKLEREYQRIRYNVKVNAREIPGVRKEGE